MPLGMEVGLGPGDIVLDGDPVPPKRGTTPNFRPMFIVAKGLDGSICHLVRRYRPRPRRHCVRWGPSPLRGTPPIFGPCLLWPNGRSSQLLLSSSSSMAAVRILNLLCGWLEWATRVWWSLSVCRIWLQLMQ